MFLHLSVILFAGMGRECEVACVQGEMATEAGGMNPTGMHSCFVNHCTVGNLLFWQSLLISECIPDTIVSF